jgi:hypothetical protein
MSCQRENAMCSGCAGDYYGGFDDDDDDDDDSGLSAGPPRCSGEADDSCRWDFEAGFAADSGCSPRDEDVENCEILVSATRIVEIRFFDSNPRQIFSLTGERARESHSCGDHYEAKSAKYYQTCDSVARSPRKSAEVFDFHGDSGVVERRPLWRRWAGLLAKLGRANGK